MPIAEAGRCVTLVSRPVSFGSGMSILAMTAHGQDARATANGCGMAILAMTAHGQDARATANGCGMAILAMTAHGQDARAWSFYMSEARERKRPRGRR